MAIRKGNFILGSIEGSVFKVFRGTQVIQSAPGKGGVKQTRATKKSAGLFGKGSALAAEIRRSLYHVIHENGDGTMVSRLTTEMAAIVRHCYQPQTETFLFETDSFKSLTGFNFNQKSPFQKSLWLDLENKLSENTLTVTLPQLKIPEELKFPNRTNLCRITVCITLISLKEGLKYQVPVLQTLDITSDQHIAEKHDFEFAVPEGCLCVAGIGLNYFAVNKGITVDKRSKDFNPAVICAAFVNNGTFHTEEPNLWIFRDKIVFKAASDTSATTDQASPHLQP